MCGCHETLCLIFHFQSGECLKYFTASVIEQKDAQITTKIGVPKCVHVIKETQVADYHKIQFIRTNGVTDGSRKRSFYTARPPVAADFDIFGECV